MVASEPTTVVLADDHPLFRRGLRDLLEREGDIRIVGEAADGGEALLLVAETDPDVLLLDIELPVLSGVEVATRLHSERRHRDRPRILALTMHEDLPSLRCLLSTGAAGYLTKAEAGDVVVEAVRRVADGERGWISEDLAAQLAASQEEQGLSANEERRKILSARELEVLRSIAEGLGNKQVGSRLGISVHTVKNHLANIYSKLEVQSRVEAIVWAQRHGILARGSSAWDKRTRAGAG